MDIFKVARQYHQKLAQEEPEDRRDTIQAPPGEYPAAMLEDLGLDQEEDEFDRDVPLDESFEEEAPDTERGLQLSDEDFNLVRAALSSYLKTQEDRVGDMSEVRDVFQKALALLDSSRR